jgi:hypothetical protein
MAALETFNGPELPGEGALSDGMDGVAFPASSVGIEVELLMLGGATSGVFPWCPPALCASAITCGSGVLFFASDGAFDLSAVLEDAPLSDFSDLSVFASGLEPELLDDALSLLAELVSGVAAVSSAVEDDAAGVLPACVVAGVATDATEAAGAALCRA